MPIWALWLGIALAICCGGMTPVFCVCLVVAGLAIEALRWAGWRAIVAALTDLKSAL